MQTCSGIQMLPVRETLLLQQTVSSNQKDDCYPFVCW